MIFLVCDVQWNGMPEMEPGSWSRKVWNIWTIWRDQNVCWLKYITSHLWPLGLLRRRFFKFLISAPAITNRLVELKWSPDQDLVMVGIWEPIGGIRLFADWNTWAHIRPFEACRPKYIIKIKLLCPPVSVLRPNNVWYVISQSDRVPQFQQPRIHRAG